MIALFAIIQFICFALTYRWLKKFKGFFTGRENCEVITSDSGVNSISCNVTISSGFRKLIDFINAYISKTGVADFSLIKDKTDRILDSDYDHATAYVSFPTLIGLLGTFFGVACGLVAFKAGLDASETISNSNISELIYGVVISMVTSVVGLILMIVSHIDAARCKKYVESERNEFYDFIQTEVLAVDSKDVASAVSKLNHTIGSFVAAFKTGTSNFEKAFTENSDKFTQAFEGGAKTILEAVEQIKSTTDAVGRSLTEQKAIVDRQVALVEEIKSTEITETMQAFIDAAKNFTNATDTMHKLESYKMEMMTVTNGLIQSQKDYLSSLDVPKQIAERLSGILDRFKTFEANINNLGKDVAQTQLLGHKEMNLISAELQAIKSRSDLAASYHNKADEELEVFYKDQIDRLKSLTGQFQQTLASYSNQFDAMMKQVTDDMRVKRDSLMKVLTESFNVGEATNDLKNLNDLPAIKSSISDLHESVKSTPGANYLDSKFSELRSAIEGVRSSIKSSPALGNSNLLEALDRLNETLEKSGKHSSSSNSAKLSGKRRFLFFGHRK